jgi:hypothetical protein
VVVRYRSTSRAVKPSPYGMLMLWWECSTTRIPPEGGVVLNAQTVLDAYREYVKSNGATSAPPITTVEHNAEIISPLMRSYADFIVQVNSAVKPKDINSAKITDLWENMVLARFPMSSEWSNVPGTQSYIGDTTVTVGPANQVTYVVASHAARSEQDSYRFDRFHVQSATRSGHRVAGGDSSLQHVTPAVSAIPLVDDISGTNAPLVDDDLKAADTACRLAKL